MTLAGQGIATTLTINSIRTNIIIISIILVITESFYIPGFQVSLLLYTIHLKKTAKINLTDIITVAKVWLVVKTKGESGGFSRLY